MTKYLLCILLLLTCIQAKAEQSLINLLYTQCERLPSIDILSDAPLAKQQHSYEQQSLAINNISDSLNYLRQYPLNTSTTEKLINCQMELAKIWDNFIRSDSATSFIDALNESSARKQKLLGLRLNISKQKIIPENDLARLRTMEAIFRSNLKTKTAKITIGNKKCALYGFNQFGFEEEYSISSYLINQPNQECRKLVWNQFYQRPYLAKSLNEIVKIRTQQAKSNGYADYTHLIIANNFLNTPELIEQFLTKKLDQQASLPWNIGSELANAPGAPKNKTKFGAETLILNALKSLAKFSISYDFIDNQVIRLWYKGHLLGDIVLITGIQYQALSDVIRYPIVGYQFAQARLFTTSNLETLSQKKYLLNQLAKVITDFAKTSESYLTSNAIESNDSANIGVQWLSKYFIYNQLNENIPNQRQALAKQYLKQLNILRARVALRFYTNQGITKHDLTSLLTSTFGTHFPVDNNYLLNFEGMIDSGPSYYAKLWQKDLASYLYQFTLKHDLEKNFFEYFIINEQQLSFQENLQLLLNWKISKEELITLVTKQTY